MSEVAGSMAERIAAGMNKLKQDIGMSPGVGQKPSGDPPDSREITVTIPAGMGKQHISEIIEAHFKTVEKEAPEVLIAETHQSMTAQSDAHRIIYQAEVSWNGAHPTNAQAEVSEAFIITLLQERDQAAVDRLIGKLDTYIEGRERERDEMKNQSLQSVINTARNIKSIILG